jgi:hypothetical protein
MDAGPSGNERRMPAPTSTSPSATRIERSGRRTVHWLPIRIPGIDPSASQPVAARSTLSAERCARPAAQRRTAAWKMSVPTTFAAVRGKTTRSMSPKKVPLPTDVSPSTKPPRTPPVNAMARSRAVSR